MACLICTYFSVLRRQLGVSLLSRNYFTVPSRASLPPLSRQIKSIQYAIEFLLPLERLAFCGQASWPDSSRKGTVLLWDYSLHFSV